MIEVIRDDNNNIKAVCEWLPFDYNGVLKDNGEVIVICELEICPEYRGNGMVRKIAKILYMKNPQFKNVVWAREYKYKGRKPKTYTKQQIKKFIGE